MAYKNSRGRNRRYSRRRRGNRNTIFNYSNPTVKAAYRALRIANYVKNLINVEFKRYDIINNLSLLPGTQTVYNLSTILQGDEINQRNGRSVLAKSNYLTGYLSLGDDIPNAIVRIIIFYDKNSNTSIPTAGQLLTAPTNIVSPLNTETAGNRFIIMSDKRYQLDQENNPKQWVKNYYKMPNNHHLVWSDATNTTFQSGHVFMLILCLHNQVATLPVGFSMVNRITYIDN